VREAQRRIGDRDGVAYMSFALASMATAQGDLAEAHRRLIECLTVAAEVGFLELIAYALGVAAELALAAGEPETAAVLVAASREGFSRVGSTPQVHEAERHERVLASLAERWTSSPPSSGDASSGTRRPSPWRWDSMPARADAASSGRRAQGRIIAPCSAER
jgi:hypothetical protein